MDSTDLPRDFDALVALIEARFDALSPQLRRGARHLVDNPDEVALRSMRDIAGSAGITPATLVRLAKLLGFAGYPELRELFAGRLRGAGSRPFSPRAVVLSESGTAQGLYDQSFAAQIGNLEATWRANGVELMTQCAETLERASDVYVVGYRSCYPLAYFLHYVYRLFRREVHLVSAIGGTFGDELRGLGPGDAVIAIGLAPYSREILASTRIAADRGAALVAITDSALSPLAAGARHALLFGTETPSFFHSMSAASATIETLLALLSYRGGERALSAIREAEAQLAEHKAYIDPPGKGTR